METRIAHELLDFADKLDASANLALDLAGAVNNAPVSVYACNRAEWLVNKSERLTDLASRVADLHARGIDPYNSLAA